MKTHPIENLKELISYDLAAGVMFWKERTPVMFDNGKRSSEHKCNNWNSRYAGTRAFNVPSRGYLVGYVNKVRFFSHRVIWALHAGQWPQQFIDHINHDGRDNRIANLREASHQQNMSNSKSRKNSTSNFVGVSWDGQRDKWSAQISADGDHTHLGRFGSEHDAAKAYDIAALRLYGKYANPNFPMPEGKL